MSSTTPFQEPVDAEILRQVRELLSQVLTQDVSSDDTDVVESGLLDSLALVELLVGIERMFGVQVDLVELDLDDFRTVRRIADAIARTGVTPSAESTHGHR
jgi:D-alanine--poly(phosphoribitol) ligase subunit 2